MKYLYIIKELTFVAGIVQRLVCKPSKLEMRVRFPLPAPRLGVRRSWRAGADCKSVGLSLSWFESSHSHQKITHPCGGCFFGGLVWRQNRAGSTTLSARTSVCAVRAVQVPRRHAVPRESATPTKTQTDRMVGLCL